MKRTILLTLLLFAAQAAFAQTPPQPSPQMVAANQLYQQKKYGEAAVAFGEILKTEPNNGRAWYFLGMSYMPLAKYEQAAAAFEKNLTINPQNVSSMYNAACAYSRLKQPDKAFEWLNKAVTIGAGFMVNAATDADLENIRGDARFPKFLDSLDRALYPCKYSTEAHQLDFWIGTWDVFNVPGQKVGTNTIEPFADGCALLENWTATIFGTGKSINYYDTTTQKWYQHWIGSGGGALRYAGTFRDGAMRFESETIGTNGAKVFHRLTFSKNDDGSVRQFSEISNDEGKTWAVNYDFKYVKAK